jgi:uncharacterized protein with PQ loop repeat
MTGPTLKRTMTWVGLLLGALLAGGCATLGIHDTQSLLLPTLHRSEIVGFVAGFGTTFAAMPDMIRMIRSRSSKGINPTMAGIIGVFQIAWIYYGLLIASRPVIAWNVVGVAINFMMVAAYRRFARAEAGRPVAG